MTFIAYNRSYLAGAVILSVGNGAWLGLYTGGSVALVLGVRQYGYQRHSMSCNILLDAVVWPLIHVFGLRVISAWVSKPGWIPSCALSHLRDSPLV